jgi:hypothetical protein
MGYDAIEPQSDEDYEKIKENLKIKCNFTVVIRRVDGMFLGSCKFENIDYKLLKEKLIELKKELLPKSDKHE